jgi:hypothetical protein
MSDVLLLNQTHIFTKDILGNFVFEDGLTCDYNSADMKAKMLQVLIALAPTVEKLDFAREDCLDFQKRCVSIIRSCLDMDTFDKGNVKTVHKERHRTGKIGKMALFGQGNCHGCSSVISAFLLPF